MRAAIYARASFDPKLKEKSVTDQLADNRALAERLGWDVVAEFVDNNKSAWKKNRRRPGWDQLLAGIEEGFYDAIICWHGDRLMRHPWDLEVLLRLADERGVRIASPASTRDLSNPDDRYILRIETAHACRASDDTSRRLIRAHERMATEGTSAGGGYRPFGFEQDRRTHHPEEAKLVREAVRRLLAGEGLRTVCADWDRRGVRTVTGKRWTVQVMRQMATSARIAGWRSHKGRWTSQAEWEPIVPENDVRRLSERFSRRGGRAQPRSYLLTGLVVCGLCDKRLVARPRTDGARCYVCSSGPNTYGCGRIRVLAEPLEDQVSRAAIEAAADLPELTTSETEPLRNDLDRLLADLDQLASDHYVGKLIGRSEFFKARSELTLQIDHLNRRLIREENAAVTGRFTVEAEEWDDLTFDRKRALLAGLVEKVTIHPAVKGRNHYDPERVSVTFLA